ncbi:MAG: Gldg family protein, partial [Candidatus Neomarinimicrobiota bacterium]|nr:Gldg family protein [Candidatus Neomarinimicrobiota bacterium]
EEYVAISKGKIKFEFASQEKLKEEAQKSGIPQRELQVIENDKVVLKRVLMGMVILFEDKKEVLPVIQTTTGLEYEITTKIKKLVEINKPTVGIAQLDGQAEQYQNIQNVLRQRYDVRLIKLNDAVPVDIQAILMGGISDSLTTNENKNLSEFMNRGGNIFIAQNRIKTNLQIQQAFPIESDIFSILEEYGFSIEANLVTDKICGRVNVQQQMGPIRMNVPMEYPLLPIVRNFNADEPIVSGLEQMQLIFPSEIKQDSSSIGQVRFTPLFFTSEQSGELKGTFNLSPDPKQNPFMRIFNKSNQVLGARTELVNSLGALNQVILVSDSEFMADNGGGRSPENHIFILNSVDYLIGDQDLIALRSREITSRPLQDISDGSKRTWKWANIITPCLLIIGFGLIRMRRQKSRSDVLEELYG